MGTQFKRCKGATERHKLRVFLNASEIQSGTFGRQSVMGQIHPPGTRGTQEVVPQQKDQSGDFLQFKTNIITYY